MLHIRQGYHAYTSSHRIFYPSSVAAKRIKRLPGPRKQGVKRLNVGLVHAAQRLAGSTVNVHIGKHTRRTAYLLTVTLWSKAGE